MRRDKLSAVFGYAQRGAVQHAVQSGGNFRGDEVYFVKQQQASVTHGQRERAVLIGHVAFLQAQVADKIGKFQTAMSGHFKDGILQAGGKLSDAAAFAAARRAEHIERIVRGNEPDNHIPACLGKAEMRINGRRKGGCVGISLDEDSRCLAAENQTGIKFHRLQAGKFFMKRCHGDNS